MHIKLSETVALPQKQGPPVVCGCIAIVKIHIAPQTPMLRYTCQYGNVIDGAWEGVGGGLPAITLRDKADELGAVPNPAYDVAAKAPDDWKPEPAPEDWDEKATGPWLPKGWVNPIAPTIEGVTRKGTTAYSDLDGDTDESALLLHLLSIGLVSGEVVT